MLPEIQNHSLAELEGAAQQAGHSVAIAAFNGFVDIDAVGAGLSSQGPARGAGYTITT